MAEVLGLVGSIVGLIQFTGKLTVLSYGYIGGVKRASKDITQLVQELGSLGRVLIDLKDFVDDNPDSKSLQRLNDKDGPLQKCLEELKDLEAKLEPRNGVKGVIDRLKWPLKEADTQMCIMQLERQKGLFQFALELDHISLSKKIEAYARDTDLVVQNLQCEAIIQKKVRSAETRSKVINWIDPDDPSKKHVEISNNRHKNTGGWLLVAPAFKEWAHTNNNPSILWGYGIPGAGKTFLSSVVIDHFKAEAATEGYGVAYVYFDYKAQDQQKPIKVLTSLVKQLMSQIRYLPEEIGELYDKFESKGERPKTNDLYTVLLTTFNSFGPNKVFLVFDALDECHKDNQRKDLLPLFHRIIKDGAKIFITSRQYPEDIQESFSNIPKIALSAQDLDIETYIRQKISENPKAKRLIQRAKCEERIISELVDCAKGMFLLVRFHIEYLCQQTTPKQILAALGTVKTSLIKDRPLDPTYDRAMETLKNKPKSCADLGLLILSWIVKAKRTLTLEELLVAISIEEGRYELDELDFPEKNTILDVCAGLVTIDEESNTVRLVHYTVQEYLLENSVIPERANFDLAMACITFFSFDIFATEGACTSYDSLYSREASQPFVRYAAKYLDYHLRESKYGEDLLIEMLLKFLQMSGSVSSYLQLSYYYGPGYYNPYNYPKKMTSLHVASRLGNTKLVRQLQGEGISFSAQDTNGWTALHHATSQGHKKIIQELFTMGVDSSIKDRLGDTVLHHAIKSRSAEVAKLLLENGTDSSVRNLEGKTALHLSVSRKDLVQLLLSHGADLSILSEEGETALQLAISVESHEVIRLLLEHGADFATQDAMGRTLLYFAAWRRNYTLLKYLLENGADPNAPCVVGTALHAAAFRGNEVFVKLLLDAGVETTTLNDHGATALHCAAQEGNKNVFQMMVDTGADYTAMRSDGVSMLQSAAIGGNEVIVQFLLDKGADVSLSDINGIKSLHTAARYGHGPVVKMLLKAGADPFALTNHGLTPLDRAVARGFDEVVSILKEAMETKGV